MQLPVTLLIGLRYSQSRKGNAFLSFITLFSVTGIFLGVLALTVVSSVMNGFEAQLKTRILGALPHLVLQGEVDTEKLRASYPQISQIAPFLQSEALVQSSREMTGALLQGIDVDALPPFLANSLVQGDWASFGNARYQIMLGSNLADHLHVRAGQKVRLILPAGGSYTPIGWLPRQRNFTIAGIIETGSELDRGLVVLRLADLQKLTNQANPNWRLSLRDPFLAPALTAQLSKEPGVTRATDWRETHGKLFAAVATEKAMMWLMLLLIVAVAAFNIVSALVMMVTEKQREVAILKTQGMTSRQLFTVFAVQGMSHGVSGALLGAVAGVIITLQLNNLLEWLGIQLVPGLQLPVLMRPVDVALIVLAALILTGLAVIYPAWRAVQIEPAEVLREQ
jgi:lipoprotein-releasing system permease protein